MKISIQVKPNSKKGPLIINNADGTFIIYIREIAKDGQANTAAINLLSKHLDVPKSKLKIISGFKSHNKIVEIID